MQLHGDMIRVFQPNGKTHAYWASAEHARKLIFEGRANGVGNKWRYYAVRLKVSAREHNRRVLMEAGTAERVKGIPILHGRRDPGINAMLAPSPRSGWAFKAAVHRNKQGRTAGERVYMKQLAS